MKNRNRNIDLFKLSVTILLILILIILLIQKPGMDKINEKKEAAGTNELEGIDVEEKTNVDQFPLFPLSDGSLELDEEGLGLFDIDGIMRLKLSDDKQTWEPVIPGEILNMLPDDYVLTSDESNVLWYIVDGNGDLLYSFNSDLLEWNVVPEKIMEAQGATRQEDDKEIAACEGANPARLTSVGSRVRVVNALIPLRSSPDAESENILISLPKETILEIVNLPVCTLFLDGANLWWGVRTENGLEGWAAEASAISDVYYLQEIQ